MPSSEMWRRVNLVRTEVSEECVDSVFKVEKIRGRKIVTRLLTD
jgi:hypothetical protein